MRYAIHRLGILHSLLSRRLDEWVGFRRIDDVVQQPLFHESILVAVAAESRARVHLDQPRSQVGVNHHIETEQLEACRAGCARDVPGQRQQREHD